MSKKEGLPVDEDEERGLSRLLPTIPDVLGWVLTFFVLWLIYTGVTKGAEFFSTVEFSAPDTSSLSDSLPSKDVGEKVKHVLDSAVSDVTESLDALSAKAKEHKNRVLSEPESQKPAAPNREKMQRF